MISKYCKKRKLLFTKGTFVNLKPFSKIVLRDGWQEIETLNASINKCKALLDKAFVSYKCELKN